MFFVAPGLDQGALLVVTQGGKTDFLQSLLDHNPYIALTFPPIMFERSPIAFSNGVLPGESLTLDESTLLNTLLRTLDKGPQILSSLEEMTKNVLSTPFHVAYFLPLLMKAGYVCPTVDGKYERVSLEKIVFLPDVKYLFGTPEEPMRCMFSRWCEQISPQS